MTRGKKLSRTECIFLAEARGGKFNSEMYMGTEVKHEWECNRGHKWEASVATIKSGSWCPRCKKVARKSIDDMKRLAEARGGECLSTSYKNSTSSLKWKCGYGHIWDAKPQAVIKKTWCPECAKRAPITIEKLKKFAMRKGGDCLSTSCLNSSEKIEWKCSSGHKWKSTVRTVVHAGCWCPYCKASKGEKLTRSILEETTGFLFKKVRPQWLKYNGVALELDGYCKEREIAFEYQGVQHQKFTKYFHDSVADYESQVLRDQAKRVMCAERGILLLEIQEVRNPTHARIRRAIENICFATAFPLHINPEFL